MEPEVHIIEKYLQETQSLFTITNIRLKGGKEIDLLAIDASGKNRYHIECRIATERSFRLSLGDAPKKGLDYLIKRKFNDPRVSSHVKSIFKSDDYSKVLVVWDVQNEKVIEDAKKRGIEIWLMRDILKELNLNIRCKGYRDDILRTIELMGKEERKKPLYSLSMVRERE